ncbi:MAG: PcfK-like family protein, partial [Oscillospiraceae bacterium]|nr:PcfK-like family protein [Oscillospiraceae bacterium]
MLMNKQEQSMEIDGMEYCVGMEIRCNEASDYAGLHGRILELRDGDDKESDNETIDIVCELYVPDNAEDREKIESRFSELYSRTVTVDDIGLDYVIMAPSMLESPEHSSEKDGGDGSGPALKDETSDQKKKEHEAAEAKRKAEWETKQADKKASDEKALEDIRAMSDGSATDASVKKLGCDVERITRRNMKICVADHIQALCTANPDFARKVMHPRKNIINCFRYI